MNAVFGASVLLAPLAVLLVALMNDEGRAMVLLALSLIVSGALFTWSLMTHNALFAAWMLDNAPGVVIALATIVGETRQFLVAWGF